MLDWILSIEDQTVLNELIFILFKEKYFSYLENFILYKDKIIDFIEIDIANFHPKISLKQMTTNSF